METRNRGKRADPGPPPKSPAQTRKSSRNKTRQETATVTTGSAASPRSARQSSAAQSMNDSTRKALYPASRRGAPINARREPSIASIATDPVRPDDATELAEEEERDESEHASQSSIMAAEQDTGRLRESESPAAGEQVIGSQSMLEERELDDQTRLQIMFHSIHDLANATESLMGRLRHSDLNDDDQFFHHLLKLKRNAFTTFREIYEEEDTAPFIDWTQLVGDRQDQDSASVQYATQTVIGANMVTALDEIYNIQAGRQTDALPLLKKLHENFPTLFAAFSDQLPPPELTLNIRTQYLIKVLEIQKGRVKSHPIIASIFCEPSDADLAVRFAEGPFRKLSGDDDDYELCGGRILEIIQVIKSDQRGHGVLKLKKMYPLHDALDTLKEWLLTAYSQTLPQTGAPRQPKAAAAELYHDAQEEQEIEESQGDAASESQPIIRADSGEEGPTLFRGHTSIRYLNEQRNSSAPPSNQQAVPDPSAPLDYQHSNAELLGSPPPPSSSAFAQASQGQQRQPYTTSRPQTVTDDNDDEDDDSFQTDTRNVSQGKRVAIASNMRPTAKRSRIAFEQHQAAARGHAAVSSQPLPRPVNIKPPPSSSMEQQPPSRMMPPPPAPPSSSMPNFAALKEEKRLISQQARQERLERSPNAFKQRHVWSDHDCLLLLELVRERQAGWATIEHLDNDRFEHPRNQQAYRDKARNMKVDYIMTNSILPPCFDQVALGRKEIAKLESLGKNPFRKESDIDPETGRAINTELGA